MFHRKPQGGFTLIELMVTMTVGALIAIAAYQFFGNSLGDYFDLEQNSAVSGELADSSQRIATVLRGTTGITAAGANDLTAYAYFAPDDSYVSVIRYYLNASNTQLLADVTPMTANPPVGTPITAQKKTYVVIQDYLKVGGLDLFNYLDDAGNSLSQPISDLNSIKGIQINLAVPINRPKQGGNQQISLQVTLRNRKTNL